MRKVIPIIIFTSLLAACQKEIDIELPDVEQRIVVDGGIYVGRPAEVTLTWSAGYFDPIDSASLANFVITTATVTVTNGTTTDTLQLTFDPNLPIPLVWRGGNIIGQVGGTYTLTVVSGGKTVTSTTTIPAPIPLDSVWFKVEIPGDSLGFAWAHMTDPSGYGNGYRWFTKRLHKDNRFLAPYGSTFDDDFIEGESFDFAYNRPSEPNSTATDDNDNRRGYFVVGDTVVVQFCAIGTAEVDFFRSFEMELGNNGNPFASPGVVEHNIEGGLGIFCGYAPTYDTIICQ